MHQLIMFMCFIYMITIAGVSTAIPKLMAEYSATGHERDAFGFF